MNERLDCQVERRFPVAVVRMRGVLDRQGARRARAVLVRCLAEQPTALVVDLAEVEATDDLALELFPTLRRRAAEWPGTAVLLYAPLFQLANALHRTAVASQVPVFATRAEALAEAAARPVPPRVRQTYPPSQDAPLQARAVVAGACTAWGLPDAAWSAQLITSELVANAVVHAGTPLEFSMVLRDPRLHLSVRDGDRSLPRRSDLVDADAEGGRGLLVVDALASAWGYVRTTDGKTVWAALPLRPDAVAGSAPRIPRRRASGEG